MEQEERLERALDTLRSYVLKLAAGAGETERYGEELWQGIRQSPGLLQELAWYHDKGSFLCRYAVEGYTLADVLVWQVDHFKAFLDRPDEMNRYDQDRLLWSAFQTMLAMQEHPEGYQRKMREETGTDYAGKY